MTEIVITTFAIVNLIFVAIGGLLFYDMLDDFIQDGMIFSFWGKIIERNGDKEWTKPMFGCPRCTNVWTTVFMLSMFYFATPVFYVLFCISLGNYLLSKMY